MKYNIEIDASGPLDPKDLELTIKDGIMNLKIDGLETVGKITGRHAFTRQTFDISTRFSPHRYKEFEGGLWELTIEFDINEIGGRKVI